MKTSRSASLVPLSPSARPTRDGGLTRSWAHFWFAPTDPFGLHVVRMLAGLLFLAWLLPFAGSLDSLFSLQGWFDERAYLESANVPESPGQMLSWSLVYACGSSIQLLTAFYWLSVLVLVLFTLGVATRFTSILTWVIVGSFTANPAVAFDADIFLNVLAFYLMIGYMLHRGLGFTLLISLIGALAYISYSMAVGNWIPGLLLFFVIGLFIVVCQQWVLESLRTLTWDNLLAWDTWLLGQSAEPVLSVGANLALRLLQVHFTIIMVTSGLHKLQFGDWWAGVALWYPYYPPFVTTTLQAQEYKLQRESLLSILSLSAYAVLIWQIAFPLFAWRRGWRPVLLGGAVLGWLGMVFLFRFPIFGPAIFIGCVSFVTPAEWHAWISGLARLVGWHRLADRWEPTLTEEPPLTPSAKNDEVNTYITLGQR